MSASVLVRLNGIACVTRTFHLILYQICALLAANTPLLAVSSFQETSFFIQIQLHVVWARALITSRRADMTVVTAGVISTVGPGCNTTHTSAT